MGFINLPLFTGLKCCSCFICANCWSGANELKLPLLLFRASSYISLAAAFLAN